MAVSRVLVASAALLVCSIIQGTAQERPASPSARQATAAPATATSVEHGRYLVEQVVMCLECHSPRDAAGNLLSGQELTGGPVPVRPTWPNDWAIYAPRIRGLPGYTDELGLRLLTEGAIDRNGARLRSPMPRFRMSRDDAAAVVAYLKSLQ